MSQGDFKLQDAGRCFYGIEMKRIGGKVKKNMLLFLISIFLMGCATIQLDAERQQFAMRQARSVFGEGANYQVYSIPSRGQAADSMFIAQSLSQGPSLMARQIAMVFEKGKSEETLVAITGVNASKNMQVIKDAFSLNRTQLPFLKLLFLGPEKYRDWVEKSL